jgi:phage-related protein
VVVRELITFLGFKLDDGPLKKYDNQIDAAKAQSGGLATAARGIGIAYKVAAAAVAVGVSWISKNLLEVTAQTENYRVTLGTMIGDQEKANKIIHDLDYSPLSDLYGTDAAIGGLQGLVTFGVQAEEAADIMQRLGDIAQGDKAALVSMGQNMGQIFAKGKADSMDLKQFVTRGFDVVGVIAEKTGKSREIIEKEGVSYKQAAEALRILTSEGGKYHGMLAKQMNTLSGIKMQFVSLFNATYEAIGMKVLEPLKDVLRYVLEIGKSLQGAFVEKGAKALGYLIHLIAQIIIFFEVFQMRLKKMGVSFEPLIGTVRDVFAFIVSTIDSAMPFIQNLGAAILAAFGPIRAFVQPVLEKLKRIIADVFSFLSGVLEKLTPKIRDSADFFGVLGTIISNLIGPVLALAFGIKAINTAIAIGKGIKTFADGLSILSAGAKAGNLLKMSMAMQQLGASQGMAQKLSETFALLTGKMDLATAAANKNKVALIMQAAASVKAKIAAFAHAAAEKIRAVATKIVAAAQGVLNAVMAVNPITLIILAVVALIAVFALLYKNNDKFRNFINGIGKAISGFFKMVWGGIVGFFKKVIQFIRANALKIVAVLGLIFFTIPTLIALVVAHIIKHWDTIKAAILKVVSWVVDKVTQAWNSLVGIVISIIEKVKAAWSGIVGFFKKWGEVILQVLAVVIFGIPGLIAVAVRQIIKHWDVIGPKVKAVWEKLVETVKGILLSFAAWFAGLWDGIVNTAMAVGDTLKSRFSGLVEGIKAVWSGIVGFFSGLWEALKEGPSSALEYIKNAFFTLFEKIQEKFMMFIDVIRGGWEKVKGFFSGIGQGVVNFFTGGEGGETGSAGSMQPALAGGGNLAGTAMQAAAARNTYYNTGGSSSQTINSNATISVNVPPGTSAEQARAISRQVDHQMQKTLADAIGGSRGVIPSPEVRRY